MINRIGTGVKEGLHLLLSSVKTGNYIKATKHKFERAGVCIFELWVRKIHSFAGCQQERGLVSVHSHWCEEHTCYPCRYD